jgi:hypothetical protein
MKSKLTLLLLITLLCTQLNAQAAPTEVESIYESTCQLGEQKQCKVPYLTCQDRDDGKGSICVRKGFFPAEGMIHQLMMIYI